jgi:hypothetical protein
MRMTELLEPFHRTFDLPPSVMTAPTPSAPPAFGTAEPINTTPVTAGRTDMEGVEQIPPQPGSSTAAQEPVAPVLPPQTTSSETAQPSNIASTSAATETASRGASAGAEESIHVYGPAATSSTRPDAGK